MKNRKRLWIAGGLLILLGFAGAGAVRLQGLQTEPAGSAEAGTAAGAAAASRPVPSAVSGTSPAAEGPYDLVATLKGDPGTSRAFTWYTADTAEAGLLQMAQGSDASLLESGQAKTIQAVDSVQPTEDGDRGVHKADVTGLSPGTEYIYRVGSGRDGEWSSAYTFTTAKANPDSVAFIDVTDAQGGTPEDFAAWGRTLQQAFNTFPASEFVVHTGDFTEDPDNPALWDAFFGDIRPLAAVYPLVPVVGNNDVSGEGGVSAYLSHFNLPDNGARDTEPGTSYSFNYGPVHMIVLNTEDGRKKQEEWLRSDLAATDKPWKIVAMHRPAYGDGMDEKVEDWIPVFDEFGVDLVLQGHNHVYSRSYPLLNGSIVEGERPAGAPEGTVYVIPNAAGEKFGRLNEDQFYHAVHFQNDKSMFAGITVTGDTLHFQAYDTDGNMRDEFILHHSG